MLIHHPRSTPQLHRDFLDRAVSILAADSRVVGVAAAGSYSADLMDDYSDLDLVVVCEGASFDEVMQSRKQVASKLGRLVAAFTGEHVGEPRLLICLYGPPALHVDLKFVRIEDLKDRVDQPTVLWERDVRLTEALAHGKRAFPPPDHQWIEDRFWVWVHYGASKIARGELQEALDFFSFLRGCVLGPLGLERAGKAPIGVRRVELVPELASLLANTVATLNAPALLEALENTIAAYRTLRASTVKVNTDGEYVAMNFLHQVRSQMG
ncbi:MULTISPECIES: nucleotidyltransferase domain-containing protein [Acidovorax]|jgi:hypothetical protein|uniref:nucleotidyltransferase domain-containing protein n=1 Tax=Acidovorax TaxID=12916 RepID=UPI000C695D94|nr:MULTISPECIES: nucleotidyltransferase domain-containing protein [unclassified Acidovorax]MCT6721277.1 nucleotidyltransferase domain-containing protein [Acidovorax sp. K2F]PIF20508.1 nucleotidyltransferase-like protein [Acidovorax sp. 59]PTT36918.1 oxalate:formate antiporter [Acidovorax sp. HMWF018]